MVALVLVSSTRAELDPPAQRNASSPHAVVADGRRHVPSIATLRAKDLRIFATR